MKTNYKIEYTITVLNKLTYDELQFISGKMSNLIRNKYIEETPLREAKYAEVRIKANKKQAKIDKQRPTLLKFLRKNVKVGDVVKFKGCRDGSGIRIIESVRDYVATGWQVARQESWNFRHPVFPFVKAGQVTNNSIENIVQIFDQDKKQWFLVKDLINAQKNRLRCFNDCDL